MQNLPFQEEILFHDMKEVFCLPEQVTLLPFFCEVRFVSFLCSVMYIIVCPFSSTIRIQFFQLSMLVIDKAGIIKQKCLAMIGLKNCSLGIKQKQINHSI